MRLVLLRHGPAGTRDPLAWPNDRDRPLTEKGLPRTQRACEGIASLEPAIAVVLASPLRRCLQTAECLREVTGPDVHLRYTETLAPGGTWSDVIAELEALHETSTAVLVGHEPDLGKLAGVLLFGAPAALPLRKAGACSIEFDNHCAAGKGRLRWFLPPRALRRLARQRSKA
jgi:phosphohistidine phosphatase